MTQSASSVNPLPRDEAEWKVGIPYDCNGLKVVIEYLAGDVRAKTTDTGVVVAGVMPVAYGYILGTTDIHGEEIDVYISPDIVVWDNIYIVDQVDPQTTCFDEHKVMLGFSSIHSAMDTYCSVFADGSGIKRLGAITKMSATTFEQWLGSESYSLQPACRFGMKDAVIQVVSGVDRPRPGPHSKKIDEAGGVELSVPDVRKGPKLDTGVNEEGGIDYTFYFFGPLREKTYSNLIDKICRVLDLATDKDTLTIKISSPGGSVFLMGRLVSAMNDTKAKVTTIAQGCVASAATTVWAHGHERKILPGSYFMQHMSSQMLGGKTTDIAAKSTFCMEYISKQLEVFVKIGLFTRQEVDDMIEKHSDIYVSGREAIFRTQVVQGV